LMLAAFFSDQFLQNFDYDN